MTIALLLAAPLAVLLLLLYLLMRPIPPDLQLPPDWRPVPRTIVQTRHLEGGRSW
jgi:hypothetical protein